MGNKKFATSLIALFFSGHCFGAVFAEKITDSQLLKQPGLRLIFCGTGNDEVAMQKIRKPACLGAIVDGEFFLFDAGEGSIQTLASMGMPDQDLDKAFVTHWHSDHFAGLSQVINSSWIAGMSDHYKGTLTLANDGDQLLLTNTDSGCSFSYYKTTQIQIPVIEINSLNYPELTAK